MDAKGIFELISSYAANFSDWLLDTATIPIRVVRGDPAPLRENPPQTTLNGFCCLLIGAISFTAIAGAHTGKFVPAYAQFISVVFFWLVLSVVTFLLLYLARVEFEFKSAVSICVQVLSFAYGLSGACAFSVFYIARAFSEHSQAWAEWSFLIVQFVVLCTYLPAAIYERARPTRKIRLVALAPLPVVVLGMNFVVLFLAPGGGEFAQLPASAAPAMSAAVDLPADNDLVDIPVGDNAASLNDD